MWENMTLRDYKKSFLRLMRRERERGADRILSENNI